MARWTRPDLECLIRRSHRRVLRVNDPEVLISPCLKSRNDVSLCSLLSLPPLVPHNLVTVSQSVSRSGRTVVLDVA